MASAFSAVRVKSDSSPAPCPFDDDRQGLNRKDEEEEEVRKVLISTLLERKGRRRGALPRGEGREETPTLRRDDMLLSEKEVRLMCEWNSARGKPTRNQRGPKSLAVCGRDSSLFDTAKTQTQTQPKTNKQKD